MSYYFRIFRIVGMELYLDCTGDGSERTEKPPGERGEGSGARSTAGELGIRDVLENLDVEVEAVG